MALTLSSAPPIVVLSDDSTFIDLLTDNFQISAGTKRKVALTVTVGAVEDDTITITRTDSIFTFTCKDNPDDSGLQFPSKGAGTLEDFVDNLYNAIRSNYSFDQLYEITISEDSLTITIEAWEAAEDNFLATYTGTLTFTVSGVVAGVAPTYRENFKINLAIYTADGLVEGSEMEADPDEDLHALFDIKKVLTSLVSTDFTYPEATDTLLIQRTEPVHSYYFRYWESYGFPAVNKKVYTSSTYYTLKGKSSFMQMAYYHEQGDNWWSRLLTSHKFLTLQPNNKKVGLTQIEKLFYIHHWNFVSTVKLYVKLYYTDATTDTVLKETLADVAKYDVIECNVGFQIMELGDVDPLKIVDYYEVWLTDNAASALTEKRIYYLDSTFYKQTRFFIFENSLGGFDTMRATGIATAKANYTRTQVSMLLPVDYTSKDREVMQVNQEESRKFTVNFGIMNNISGDLYAQDWKNYARQIELSEKAYEVINGRTVPVLFNTDEVELHSDNSRIYDLVLTYERAFIDNAYSDDEIPIKGDYNDDYYYDYFTGFEEAEPDFE